LTYVRNLAPQVSTREDVKATIVVNRALVSGLPIYANVTWLPIETSNSTARRFWKEQVLLPELIRRVGADVLISAGNFALRRSPVPQILLSGNSLYVSKEFRRDLRNRREFGLLLGNSIKSRLAKRSLRWADCVIAPTKAFARSLEDWSRVKIKCVHHGFNRQQFITQSEELLSDAKQKLDAAANSLRLLFVSHYNYYRNFETLLRAIPLIKKTMPDRGVKLFVTCRFTKKDNPSSYNPESAARLIRELNIGDSVVELGTVPHAELPDVYRSCDIYVTPAYAETFAFPLVEGMACGLPVVASDIPVHREICGAAATYFPTFSAADLAERTVTVANSADMKQQLISAGKIRSTDFSWSKHIEELVLTARQLVSGRTASAKVNEVSDDYEIAAAS